MSDVTRRMTSPVFVGRDAELEALDAALARTAGGVPAFAFIGGESGVGKTRLLRELETRARARGMRILRGQCLELGGAQIPYAPLIAALRPLARGLAGAEAEALPAATRNALAELLPELGGTGTRQDDEPRARQGRVFEALLGLLDQLGRGEPVLLAIEDLHWADGGTRDFITFLVRSAREERVCLAVTYRSDELHRRHPLRPLLAELERASGVERIALERFSRAEAEAQLEGIAGERPAEALTDRLFTRSQGNPLYTEELLAASEEDVGWTLPETLRDVLIARVERLSPTAQAIVRIAAVVDRPATHTLLETVADLSPAEVMEGAREAVAHQVLVIDHEGHYAFRHALVGEAVHGDLLPGEDTALHTRIASVIEADPSVLGDVAESTVAAELACHWKSAHELDRSLGAYVRAGVGAKRLYAYEVAQRHFERALGLWDRVPDAEAITGIDRVELLRLTATCAGARGEGSRAVALLREALLHVDAEADPLRAAGLHERVGNFLRVAGDATASFAAFDRAVALLPSYPSVERARVLQTRAGVEMLLGDLRQARETATRAVEEARTVGDDGIEVQALNTLGFSRAGLGEVDEGLATLRAAYARAKRPADRSRAAVNLSEALDLAGHTEEALDLVRGEVAGIGGRPERSTFDAFLIIQEASLLVRLGRLAEARATLPGRVPGEAVSYAWQFWRETRARIALLTGDLDGVRAELDALHGLQASPAEPQWVEPRADLEVELRLREDRVDDAPGVVRAAAAKIEHSDEATRLMRMVWMVQRVEAEVAGRAQALGEPYAPQLDDVDDCLRRRAASQPWFEEAGAWCAMADAERRRRRTLLGDAPADPGAWDDVARRFDDLVLPVPATYARFRAGEAHVTGGDRAAAAVALRAAAEAASAMGTKLLADDVAGLARRARIDLGAAPDAASPAPDDSPVARLGLTPRELEVLLLVAEGRTNRVIGETLFMSEKTASVHVSRILAKLGVSGRVEAAAVAHRLGLSASAR